MKTEQGLEWKPKIKFYPHFDSIPLISEAKEFATNPKKVAKHQFFPFLSYTKFTRKFGTKKIKERPISYASRRDSCIYSYYRHILLTKYEDVLKQKGLGDCVIAYRQIIDPATYAGKSNIHFAKEAFEEIKKQENCIAIALDISKFFQSILHNKIKEKWKRLLNVEELPEDHFAVFKNITLYKTVDLDSCYIKLGLMRLEEKGGRIIKHFLHERKNQPKKLCSIEDYRKKIVCLIEENPNLKENKKCGIPQGSPISDIIANMYMLDFDEEVKALMDKVGGYYRRYSDDILIVCPPDKNLVKTIITQISTSLKNREGLKINSGKTIITEFSKLNGKISHQTFDENYFRQNNAFEYLGHSFDGENTLLKVQTVTNHYKKMHRAVKSEVHRAYEKFCKNDRKGLLEDYLDRHKLYHRFSTANPEWKKHGGTQNGNFMTYKNRSAQVTGSDEVNELINGQLKRHKKVLEKAIKEEIKRMLKAKNIRAILK